MHLLLLNLQAVKLELIQDLLYRYLHSCLHFETCYLFHTFAVRIRNLYRIHRAGICLYCPGWMYLSMTLHDFNADGKPL